MPTPTPTLAPTLAPTTPPLAAPNSPPTVPPNIPAMTFFPFMVGWDWGSISVCRLFIFSVFFKSVFSCLSISIFFPCSSIVFLKSVFSRSSVSILLLESIFSRSRVAILLLESVFFCLSISISLIMFFHLFSKSSEGITEGIAEGITEGISCHSSSTGMGLVGEFWLSGWLVALSCVGIKSPRVKRVYLKRYDIVLNCFVLG